MDPGLLSRTSQAVALTRAGMSRPHTEQGDPDAQRRLCEGMTPIRRPRPGIWARTRFFDDQVLVTGSSLILGSTSDIGNGSR
jgi:hypothetical protein